MAEAKFVRVEPETHRLIALLTTKINKKGIYPATLHSRGTIKMAIQEFIQHHPELGVK